METSDLIIIGGGPGGYACAIRASQLGLKTTIIEKRSALGGTCMNVGCIPTKALLHSSELYRNAKNGFEEHGILLNEVKLDLNSMMKRKEGVVGELTEGLAFLMKKNKIRVLSGTGEIIEKKEDEIIVRVTGEQTTEVTAPRVVVATGSVPVELPFLKFDGKKIISSDEGIALTDVPENMVIIGGGVIGLELGSVWNRLGSNVTIVEMLPDILPDLDRQLRETVKRSYKKQGLNILSGTKVTGADPDGNALQVKLSDEKGNENTVSADVLMVAVGRRPFTDGLGLSGVGVNLDESGRIVVNESYQTNVHGIFAIGDVISGPMLAHKAEKEGVVLAERFAGMESEVYYHSVPSVIYTHPEIAYFGPSLEELGKEEGRKVKSGKFFFRANGRAKAVSDTEGLIQINADEETKMILSAAIVGPQASELLHQIILAHEAEVTVHELAESFFAHPTLSETVKEAAHSVFGQALLG